MGFLHGKWELMAKRGERRNNNNPSGICGYDLSGSLDADWNMIEGYSVFFLFPNVVLLLSNVGFKSSYN